MHDAERRVALRIPFQTTTGCGSRQRSSLTGGCANGIPLKVAPPGNDGSKPPCTDPAVTLTTGGAPPVAVNARQVKATREMVSKPGTNAAIFLLNILFLVADTLRQELFALFSRHWSGRIWFPAPRSDA